MVKHVGLILDGNRRYAKSHNISVKKGHHAGAEKFEEILRCLDEERVSEISAYILSTENLNRDSEEVADLFSLFINSASKIFTRLEKDDIDFKVVFAGNLDLVPKHVQKHAQKLEERTAQFTKRINLCFAYGGRDEIVRAAQKVVATGEEITTESLSSALDITSEPELIIRTGGKHRISNFMLWQSAYAEWFFLDKMWPEITKEDITNCFVEFADIQRNFGK